MRPAPWVVNKGMFDLVSNDDEIAVVLGHEMGHGQKHHVANSTQKKVNVEIGKMVLADTIGGSGLNNLILNTVSNQIETVHIDRAAEWEADNLSFGYITRAGYNPGATAAIWSWKNRAIMPATLSVKSSLPLTIHRIRNGATIMPTSSMK